MHSHAFSAFSLIGHLATWDNCTLNPAGVPTTVYVHTAPVMKGAPTNRGSCLSRKKPLVAFFKHSQQDRIADHTA